MKNWRIKFINGKYLFFVLALAFCVSETSAQSTNSSSPTPITSNEISGTIRARDLGDARLTSYYYVFNGTQGDVFINVSASNLNGDIDVFAADGLRPLSKISLYADASPTETGRIVYLRQPLKLILRVEGRTPDDNPATFRIKFAGSFAAIEGASNQETEIPQIENSEVGAVRVNSVGTIIETPRTEKVPEKKIVAVNPSPRPKKSAENKAENKPENTNPIKAITTENNENKSVDETASEPVKTPIAKSTSTRTRRPPHPKPVKNPEPEKETAETKSPPPNPLENVRLVVLMKDGNKIEYPMTSVYRFSLNNNVLTIILKDGKIERRSILDIQKFSVE